MGQEGNAALHRRRVWRRRVCGVEGIGDSGTPLSLEAVVPYTLQTAKPAEGEKYAKYSGVNESAVASTCARYGK